jgi:hypothetical protein
VTLPTFVVVPSWSGEKVMVPVTYSSPTPSVVATGVATGAGVAVGVDVGVAAAVPHAATLPASASKANDRTIRRILISSSVYGAGGDPWKMIPSAR